MRDNADSKGSLLQMSALRVVSILKIKLNSKMGELKGLDSRVDIEIRSSTTDISVFKESGFL